MTGDVLGGKYEIEHLLGEGGMCVVMAARHLQLEERVAIKFLRPELGDDPEGVERFMREGRTAIRIKNDHVVHIHDVDVLPSGTPYLVMEHLDGSDLDALILAHGPSPIALAVDYILQAGEAIAEAHSLGIVHRDLKPANLFFTRRADGSPWIKVLDFGISKMTRRKESLRQERLTGGHAVMGSPHYMSPEQLRSTRDVDERTDIWALGTILHELLTGQPAFDGPSLSAVCAKIMEAQP
ncbi:MAG: serine/threonine-protein kinase, partial [Polyangiaceae bacterium]